MLWTTKIFTVILRQIQTGHQNLSHRLPSQNLSCGLPSQNSSCEPPCQNISCGLPSQNLSCRVSSQNFQLKPVFLIIISQPKKKEIMKNFNFRWKLLVKEEFTSFVNLSVCNANSLVGDKTKARAPVLAECVFNFSNIGIKKAAVLPLPVLAMATTSFPSNSSGIVWKKETNGIQALVLLAFPKTSPPDQNFIYVYFPENMHNFLTQKFRNICTISLKLRLKLSIYRNKRQIMNS